MHKHELILVCISLIKTATAGPFSVENHSTAEEEGVVEVVGAGGGDD
jgi:hypothetical protein